MAEIGVSPSYSMMNFGVSKRALSRARRNFAARRSPSRWWRWRNRGRRLHREGCI